MRINYPVRSRFLEPCEEAIRRHKESLLAGVPMSFVLHPCRGYNGKVRVEIESGASSDFWTDWEYSDPTRFPVRIRAAAQALYTQGCFGAFEILHHTWGPGDKKGAINGAPMTEARVTKSPVIGKPSRGVREWR